MPDTPSSASSGEKSSLNIDPNLAGALCYLFGCLSGFLLFLLETENKRVRFHALQSIMLFAVLTFLSVASIILSLLTNFVPFRLASSIIWLLQFVLWLFLMIRTYQGEIIKNPGLGNFAQEQTGWPVR